MKLCKLLHALAACVVAALLVTPPARAQELPPERPSLTQTDAARDALHALMFETGLLEQALAEFTTNQVPAFRARAADSTLRQSLSERGRIALDRFIEEVPGLVEDELRIGGAELIEVTSGRVAHIFTVEEWSGIAAFLRDEDGQRMFVQLANGGRSSLTAEQIEVGRRFYATPPGQAFALHGEEMNRILYETMREQLPLIVARMQLRLLRRFCIALSDECPADLRAHLNGL